MKYSIDKIENNIAILENIETKEKIELNIMDLPNDIKEGSILIKDNEIYMLDTEEELVRRQNIINKFQRLKKKK